jgi:hypothetical protein
MKVAVLLSRLISHDDGCGCVCCHAVRVNPLDVVLDSFSQPVLADIDVSKLCREDGHLSCEEATCLPVVIFDAQIMAWIKS